MAAERRAVAEWADTIVKDPNWLEVENRPWANENARWTHSGCLGYDFLGHDPRLKLRFFWNEAEQTLCGTVDWDNTTEGPPRGSHGASIMTVFDEILAYPVWRIGTAAFTANVNINLRRMIPFNTAARWESKLVRVERRKHFIEAAIYNADKSIKFADATGLWVASNGIGGSSAVWADVIASDKARDAASTAPAPDGSGARVITDPARRVLRPHVPSAAIAAAPGLLAQTPPGVSPGAARGDGVGASYRVWRAPLPPANRVLPYDADRSPAPESVYTSLAAGPAPGGSGAPAAPALSARGTPALAEKVFGVQVGALPLPPTPAQLAVTGGVPPLRANL